MGPNSLTEGVNAAGQRLGEESKGAAVCESSKTGADASAITC